MLNKQIKIIDVAVGVVINPERQILICWRDQQLHQGNRYEFPGGKVEQDESPEQALKRELKEEINITINTMIRAQQLVYPYPEKTVRLHIFKVTDFTGTPLGQQQQAVYWVERHALSQYSFPDANAPILKMLQLPDYYVISQSAQYQTSLSAWIEWHIIHTPAHACLYVRHETVNPTEYVKIIEALQHTRPDLQLVVMAQYAHALSSYWKTLYGIHFRQHELAMLDLAALNTLPVHWQRIAACHDADSIIQATNLLMDAIVLSPVHATTTHPDAKPLGWQQWQTLALNSPLPVYALGGITPADLTTAQYYSGFGVAGISHFFN